MNPESPRARDLMTSPVLTVPPEAPRVAVAALLVSHGIASAPVVDERGRMLGLVDERGLVEADGGASAAELMSEVPVAGPDLPVTDLVDMLARSPSRAIPIVHYRIPIGIVSRRDVLRLFTREELVAATPVGLRPDGGAGRRHAPGGRRRPCSCHP